MVHQPEAQLRQIVVGACAVSEYAGLYIALTFPGTQKNITPPALFDHSAGNAVMFVLISVAAQLWAVVVPVEAGPYLIPAAFQIGVIRQIVLAVAVFDGADALHLGLDGVHDPHVQDPPDEGGLPVYGGQNALQRLIGGYLIAALFTAQTHERVGEEGVVSVYLEFYDVGMFRFQSLHLLKITGTGLQRKAGMFVIKTVGQQQYAAVE